MAKILVPDYLGQQVLSGIRSLNRNSHTIDLATSSNIIQKTLVKSRSINRVFDSPKAMIDEDGYISAVISVLKKGNYNCVIPFGLGGYYVLSKNYLKIKHLTASMLPSFESLLLANDKLSATKKCLEIGVDTPKVFSDYNEIDLNTISNNITFPVVIKARGGSGVGTGLRYARNKDELKRAYEAICSNEASGAYNPENPLIQEFIPGYVHDACTLTDNGRPLNILTQVRQVMYPVYGGVGAINITTEDKKLKKEAMKILEAFNWNGPAQVEFKYDPRDKKYKFIELNPKLWGTLDLSIKVGMDFPNMIVDHCTGKEIQEMKSYKAGVRYLFKYRQLYKANKELKKIKNSKDLYHSFPYDKTHTDFDWSDPIPDIYRRILTLLSTNDINSVNDNLSLSYVLNGYDN